MIGYGFPVVGILLTGKNGRTNTSRKGGFSMTTRISYYGHGHEKQNNY